MPISLINYKTNSNAYSISLAKIFNNTKKIFIIRHDFWPIGPKTAM